MIIIHQKYRIWSFFCFHQVKDTIRSCKTERITIADQQKHSVYARTVTIVCCQSPHQKDTYLPWCSGNTRKQSQAVTLLKGRGTSFQSRFFTITFENDSAKCPVISELLMPDSALSSQIYMCIPSSRQVRDFDAILMTLLKPFALLKGWTDL